MKQKEGNRIGIQFNFERVRKLKTWCQQHKDLNLDYDTHHVNIYLDEPDQDKSREEIRNSALFAFVTETIDRFVEHSSYTTCYIYLIHPQIGEELVNIKSQFAERDIISVMPDPEQTEFSQDFTLLEEQETLHELILENPLYQYLNAIRDFCLHRSGAWKNVKVQTSFSLEDKDEWGHDFDQLRLDVQFEKE